MLHPKHRFVFNTFQKPHLSVKVMAGFQRQHVGGGLGKFKMTESLLYSLPQGFCVNHAGDTGIILVDNFCTPEESAYLVEKARTQLAYSQVIVDGKAVSHSGRTSSTAAVFHRHHQDERVLPIIERGAMVLGVPSSNAEPIDVSRYLEGEKYNAHHDFSQAR